MERLLLRYGVRQTGVRVACSIPEPVAACVALELQQRLPVCRAENEGFAHVLVVNLDLLGCDVSLLRVQSLTPEQQAALAKADAERRQIRYGRLKEIRVQRSFEEERQCYHVVSSRQVGGRGGLEVTGAIFTWACALFAEQLQQKTMSTVKAETVRPRDRALGRLRMQCDRARKYMECCVSSAVHYTLTVECFYLEYDLSLRLTWPKHEALTAVYFQRVERACTALLREHLQEKQGTEEGGDKSAARLVDAVVLVRSAASEPLASSLTPLSRSKPLKKKTAIIEGAEKLSGLYAALKPLPGPGEEEKQAAPSH